MMIKRILNKCVLGIKAIKLLKNWPLFFLDYFGLRKSIIRYRLRKGINFEIRGGTSDIDMFNEIWLCEDYSQNTRDSISTSSPVIIDIGAQIGFFSIWAVQQLKNAKVYAYEPDPENFNLLVRNIKINKLDDRIIPFNIAVYDKAKKIKLFIDAKHTGRHSALRKSNRYIESKAISLKDIFHQNRIKNCYLLKIDAEGAEYPILYTTPTGLFKKIKRLYVEHHTMPSRKDYNYTSLRRFLEKRGLIIRDRKGIYKKDYIYAQNK